MTLNQYWHVHKVTGLDKSKSKFFIAKSITHEKIIPCSQYYKLTGWSGSTLADKVVARLALTLNLLIPGSTLAQYSNIYTDLSRIWQTLVFT